MITDWELWTKIRRLKKEFREVIIALIDALLKNQDDKHQD